MKHRAIRVAELLSRVGGACPVLPRPPRSLKGGLAVAVAFVVDTRGLVDARTLRVVESPARPQEEHRFYQHIYVVGMTADVDHDLPDRVATYDSVVTRKVARHLATLRFRPAMRGEQAIRSTVLIACQSS